MEFRPGAHIGTSTHSCTHTYHATAKPRHAQTPSTFLTHTFIRRGPCTKFGLSQQSARLSTPWAIQMLHVTFLTEGFTGGIQPSAKKARRRLSQSLLPAGWTSRDKEANKFSKPSRSTQIAVVKAKCVAGRESVYGYVQWRQIVPISEGQTRRRGEDLHFAQVVVVCVCVLPCNACRRAFIMYTKCMRMHTTC